MTTRPANAFLEAATLIDALAPVPTEPGEPTGGAAASPAGAPPRFLDVATIITAPPSGHPAAADDEDAAAPARAAEGTDPAARRPGPPATATRAPAPARTAAAPAGRLRFLDAATIQERLDDEQALLGRLEKDPSDPMAGDALEALYQRRGEHEAAIALLLDRAEVADDPAGRAGFLLRAAHLYRTEIADHDAARLVLVTALGAAPGDERIHDELDAVVCASGEFAAARTAYADAALAVEHSDRPLAGLLWLRVASLHIMERSGPAAVSAALARIDEVSAERAAPILQLCERLAGDLIVLDGLIALYHRIGDTAGASRVLALSLDHASDSQDRAGRHHVIAELAAARGDELEAEWNLAEALRLAPGRAGTRAALADLYRARGESRRAAQLLDQARLVAKNPIDRANLACQAASIYADDLGERTRAVNLYEVVIASDPERAEAAAPLAERYWERRCFAQLEPLVEVLVRRAAAARSADLAELSYRAGITALELGKPERALAHLDRALAAAPDRLDALRAAARAADALERHDEAYDRLTAALAVQEKSGASEAELADTLHQLGELAARSGDQEAALELRRAALERVPDHPRALAAAMALLRGAGELREAADLLAAACRASEGEARVRLLAERADLFARDLGDPARAIALYRDALAIAPADRAVLAALAELYSAAEAWREAVDALTRLAELEPPGLRRGRYLQIAAQLARGRLPDDETASLFARALDCYFEGGEPAPQHRGMALRAFADLEQLLRSRRAFVALERAYRTMIKRLPQSAPELPDLWSRLGALYREELDRPACAIESYEIAAALDGDRATRHRVLIDLYEGFAPDQLDKLVERRRRLLEAEPLAAEHYRALVALHGRAGRRDHVYLALRSLGALGAATPQEREQLERLEAGRPSWPRAPLGPDQHALLRHRDEDVRVTALLAAAAEAVADELAVAPRRLRLRDDASPGWMPLREMHHAVAGLLGVGTPPMMVCPELDADLLLANLRLQGRATLTVVVGGRMAQAGRIQALHGISRVLAHARPGYFLRLLLGGPGSLDAALDAALMVGGYRGSLAPSETAHRFARALDRRVSPAFRSHLSRLVRAIAEPREALSVERWSQAVDATCHRLALLVGGDLNAAIAALGREGGAPARRSQDRLADLLIHGCSEEHAAVRARIGLAIG